MHADCIDIEQRRIVEAGISERILVTAGPGTGKTHVSALRLAHLVARGARPSEILVLSFSRSAVRTLSRRIDRLTSTSDEVLEDLRHLSIRTFDSWTFRLLRQMGAQPGQLLSKSHDQNIADLAQILEGQERETARQFLSKIRHIIIDEFQDVPGVRGRLVLALLDLLGPRETSEVGFTVLGDAAQAIYGFAARNSAERDAAAQNCWAILRERYGPSLVHIRLENNYRATPELAELAKVARGILEMNTSGAERLANIKAIISGLQVTPATLDASWFDCLPPGSIAILTRSNGEATRVAQKLLGNGNEGPKVPVRLQTAGHFVPVPAWIAALLTPLGAQTLTRSQFARIYQQRTATLGASGCEAIRLPSMEVAWTRLARAAGAAESDASVNMSELRTRINWPDAFPDDHVLPDSVIYITTVHQAKGMEFDSVAILESREPKDDEKPDCPEEEASVGFVAITRAAKQLRRIPSTDIYRPPMQKEFRGARNRLCHWWNKWVNLEMGIVGDINPISFVDERVHGSREGVNALQSMILNNSPALRGHKVLLLKTHDPNNARHVLYDIHLQDGINAGMLLGRTSAQLTEDLLYLLWERGYSLPSRIMNLRIDEVLTVVGPAELPPTAPAPYCESHLWLGISLFGTGDFKSWKR
jgi:DNA helicase-2/ATP-dependent DNA helicase PcrA